MKYMDMLAKLGIGSAHPGGFSATVQLLETMPPASGSRILEVGCGTGRTACHLAQLGYEVTAVDIRRDMLDKAAIRARMAGVSVQFVQGSVEALPLETDAFDMVMAESVTLFADSQLALREYRRVLAPGGRLIDRELMAARPLSEDVSSRVNDFYGIRRVWSEDEWRGMLEKAGFAGIELCQSGLFAEIDWEREMEYPDEGSITDPEILFDERVWRLARDYDQLMSEYADYFGYGVWTAEKK